MESIFKVNDNHENIRLREIFAIYIMRRQKEIQRERTFLKIEKNEF